MADPTIRVAPPQRVPRVGGISSAAEFITDSKLLAGVGLQYDPEPCALAVGSIQLCYAPDLNLGTNEVQTVTITGTPTGGTFRLTFDGQQTATIAYNANAATVQAALEALSNIDAGYVAVTGGPGPGTPYVVQFTGPLADRNVPQMTATHAFTGGTTPAIAVTTTTAGVAQKIMTGLPDGLGSIMTPFGGYVGVECWAGSTESEYGPRARRQFEGAQDRVVEAALWTWLTALAADTTANTLDKAIAKAEQYADANYVGRPILHISREDADLATHLSDAQPDGKMFTRNGTPVVASGRYTPGTIVISGGMTIVQSDIAVHEGRQLEANKFMAIAERAFAAAVDCEFRREFTVTP